MDINDKESVLSELKEYKKELSRFDPVTLRFISNEAIREIIDVLFLGEEYSTVLDILDRLIELISITDGTEVKSSNEIIKEAKSIADSYKIPNTDDEWSYVINAVVYKILHERLMYDQSEICK